MEKIVKFHTFNNLNHLSSAVRMSLFYAETKMILINIKIKDINMQN